MAKAKTKNDKLRAAAADVIFTAGCGCCRDHEAHDAALERLGELLDVPMYEDGSGRDFYQFRTRR